MIQGSCETGRSLCSRLAGRLFQPVDIASLVFFRVAFGALLAWKFAKYFLHDWIETVYVEPAFHFTYLGFSWVKPLPSPWLHVVFALLLVSAALVALGLFYRAACAALGFGFAYVFLLEQTRFNNHDYLILLLCALMFFAPAHRALSLDARLGRTGRATHVPAWAPAALAAQMGVVYFFGAVAKMNADWLLAGEPLGHWFHEFAVSAGLVAADGFTSESWFRVGISWAGMLFDLLIVPALLWRPARRAALYTALVFHLTNSMLFEIGVFPYLAMALTLLYCDPGWPRRALPFACSALPREPPAFPRSRRVVGCLAAWFAVQVVVPLLPFFCPGNVLWTEEGHHFTWRMKIYRKEASVRFFARTPSGLDLEMDWRPYITEDQYRTMAMCPDQILQFAHFLGETMRARGFPDVEIRARAVCSLNGRPPQELIDPSVDLLQKSRTLCGADWIVPL